MLLQLARGFSLVPHILTLSSHPILASNLAVKLGYKLSYITNSSFSNAETKLSVPSVGSTDSAIVVQSPHSDINNQIMELLLTVQACKQLPFTSVTAVIPCFPYARSDKSESKNLPIAAKLICKLLEAAGTDNVITVELHSSQTEGFFNIPVSNIQTTTLISRHLSDKSDDIILVSPDAGAMKKVTAISEMTGLPFALIHKERASDGTISRMTLVGDVAGRKAVIVDDMADTCGTVIKAADLLVKMGARDVEAVMTHGILSGGAVKRINESSSISRFTVTNTLPQCLETCPKLEVIDVSELIAAAIRDSCSTFTQNKKVMTPSV